MEDSLKQISGIASIYGTDTIFILGKGPSANEVPGEILARSLVIGVNDAERIHPTDITIFHADWVKQALAETGERAHLYVTSTDFRPSNGAELLKVPYKRLQQESSDLMMQRLLSGDLAVEDILFISALKIALAVAKMRGVRQKVYMLGFDFSPQEGYAEITGRHYETGDEQSRNLVIGMQENFLLNALYMLQGSEVEIHHVGVRSYSRITPHDLVAELSPSGAHAHAEQDWNVDVIAELTTNHFGDRGRLEKMVRIATGAGADYIKVQKRDPESFYSAEQLGAAYKSPFGETFGDYRRQLELSGEDFEFLNELCGKLGIKWFASILDEPSYKFILDFKPPMIKLPSTISEHTDYLSRVAQSDACDIVLSTGMTDKAFENWVLETFVNVPKLYLMQANSAYPTPAHDCNIGVVRHYARLAESNPRIVPAYSSHDEGWYGSSLAVAAGAKMVEKHVKFGNTDWAHFDAVALDLTTSEFHDYVTKVREAEVMMGSEEKAVAPSEHHKYFRK